MSHSVWRVTKDEAIGERGMVAASHPLAVQAGLEILRRGGNAADAAVTMAFFMGVVEPAMSGIGGGGMMIIHLGGTRKNIVIDFAMDAPLVAGPETYELEDGHRRTWYGWPGVRGDANTVGYRAAAVPGAVRGLALALEQFGTMPLGEVLVPAIRIANEGVPVNWQMALWISMSMPTLSRFPTTASVFLPRGHPLDPGDGFRPAERLIQPELAGTLRMIATHGPDAFYAGPIASALCEAMRQHGGLITEEDLLRYRATVTDAVVTDYRGYQVAGVPGPAGCITVQQSLNILEGFALPLAADPVRTLHLKAEAFRLAFADRYSYLADPRHVAVPWRGLLSKAYAAERRNRIDPVRAATGVEPGNPWAFDQQTHVSPPPSPQWATGGSSCTTHLCAVDAERNVVTLTQTLVDYFGCGAMIPGTGVLLNNAMLWFDPRPGRPNSVAPGKRGVNNMAPLLVLRHGRPLLAVGAPGGHRIINAMAQVIMNVLDDGMGVQDAITAPRIDCSGPPFLIDSRLPDPVVAGLEGMGHKLQVVEETFHANHFSRPLGILIHPDTGRLHGGVDPFRLAVAGGY